MEKDIQKKYEYEKDLLMCKSIGVKIEDYNLYRHIKYKNAVLNFLSMCFIFLVGILLGICLTLTEIYL